MPVAGTSTRKPASTQDQRRSSGRQARTNISRPTNYYARPFGATDTLVEQTEHRGFFPACQYFTDAIAALPKEVMPHFTLLKEVDAKVCGPTEEMGRIAERIDTLPAPPKRNHRALPQALLHLSASSAITSANASVVNGSIAGSIPLSVAEAVDLVQTDPEIEMQRRQEFHNLRMVIGSVLANLDEKNVCLSEANRALQRQLARIDDVFPHVESEISEEARMGSLTHWAYADNRKKVAQPERSRGVAATSNLAAAAAVIRDGDIAAARNEGRKETKKSRAQAVDSEFEERIKKPTHKARKVEDTKGVPLPQQPAKKRKVEKNNGTATAMERGSSSTGRNARLQVPAPRSTPANEQVKRKTKPPPPVIKKRPINGSGPTPSPRIATSPTMADFASANDSTTTQRPASRMRQVSSALQDNNLQAVQANTADHQETSKLSDGKNSREISPRNDGHGDAKMSDDPVRGAPNGRQVKTEYQNGNDASRNAAQSQTPTDDLPGVPLARTRSTGVRESGVLSRKSSAQRDRDTKHGRSSSSQHILKQIASFNRSPTSGRREVQVTEDESSASEDRAQERSGREARALRRTESKVQTPTPEPEDGTQDNIEDEQPGDEQEAEEEHDPDDPDEPKYCYCGRGSYGTMIGCENEDCEREWFHLECTGLRAVPGDNVKWYCDDCDPKARKKAKSTARH